MGTRLATWLRSQLKERNVKAYAAAIQAGVGVATVSHILKDDHIPRMDTLIRLADYFDTPRELVLRIAAGLSKPPTTRPPASPQDEDYLIDELNEAFRRIPDEWKEDILSQVTSWARLANRPAIHILGADDAPSPRRGDAIAVQGNRVRGESTPEE